MKLYGYWRSSSAWRVRIALALKQVPYEYVAVHLRKGEQDSEAYRTMNPVRTVPLLEEEGSGGVWRLSQSMAILEYLEERYPTPALLPAEPRQRARARQYAELINSGIQPLQNLMVTQHIGSVYKQDERAWVQHWVGRGLTALEQQVGETAGEFCIGDTPTFADVLLVPQLYAARRFGLETAPFAHLERIEKTCASLPAFHAAHADRQPDTEV